MAGCELPLYFVSPNQVNALVPYDLTPNTPQQVLIQQGTTYPRRSPERPRAVRRRR